MQYKLLIKGNEYIVFGERIYNKLFFIQLPCVIQIMFSEQWQPRSEWRFQSVIRNAPWKYIACLGTQEQWSCLILCQVPGTWQILHQYVFTFLFSLLLHKERSWVQGIWTGVRIFTGWGTLKWVGYKSFPYYLILWLGECQAVTTTVTLKIIKTKTYRNSMFL